MATSGRAYRQRVALPWTGPTSRGHRVEVDAGARRAAALDGAGYSSAFTVSLSSSPSASASASASAVAVPTSVEQWGREVFEGGPRTLRWFLVFGWRAVLRLRLDLAVSPERVLGWTIVGRSAAGVVLEARSSFLTARKVIQVADAQLTASTFIRYERRWGRWIWAVVALVHHRTEPLLLTLAARRGPPPPRRGGPGGGHGRG